MQKKKKIKQLVFILIGISSLVFLAYYVTTLIGSDKKSDTELISFAVEDTLSINKLIITDKDGNKINVIRKGKKWTQMDGSKIKQEMVNNILYLIKNIEFKGYLPDASLKRFDEMMKTQHIKLEIFTKKEGWVKTWYIGPTSKDRGQIMLLDSKKEGRSSRPVIMHDKTEQGGRILDVMFTVNKKEWGETEIFSLQLNEIESVELNFLNNQDRNFKVINSKNDPYVKYKGNKLKTDLKMIYKYLQLFKKVHFNEPNYVLNKSQIDSLKKTKPFASLKLIEKSGKTTKLKMYKMPIKQNANQINESMEVVEMNMDKFWCELNDGELVKCQFFSFNKILNGHVYFPEMNVEEVIENNY